MHIALAWFCTWCCYFSVQYMFRAVFLVMLRYLNLYILGETFSSFVFHQRKASGFRLFGDKAGSHDCLRGTSSDRRCERIAARKRIVQVRL